MNDQLEKARKTLEKLTPLKTDCGRNCGGICCRSAEAEETGMLLFPGEEDLYEDSKEYKMKSIAAGTLLLCEGHCDRNTRPLACRIFPLLPVVRDGEIKVATDQRAKAVCPLARQGKNAMDPMFIEGVRQVGQILLTDPVQKAFLEELTAEQDALKELRKQLGR